MYFCRMTNKQIEEALEPYKTKYLAKWFDLHPFYFKKIISGKAKRGAKFEKKLNEFLKEHLWTLK